VKKQANLQERLTSRLMTITSGDKRLSQKKGEELLKGRKKVIK